ncbi:MAG: CBS domain-containing protein [Gammaproteobacteria bacterium]
MSRTVQSCRCTDTVARAAQLMWEFDCGCLPVVSEDGAGLITGVVTDRDICMCALFRNAPLREIPVSEAMAREVLVCHPGDSLDEAELIMREARVRRLPVADETGALVGMLSLADLAQEAVRELVTSKADISEADVGDTLAAICCPPHKELAA